jgi:hypothetical protein
MTSPQIKILISIAAVSLVYAFVCNTRLSKKAGKLANWLQKERPDLWSELNFIARNWNGGQPGLKLLYRRNVVDLPSFDQQYEQLHSIERQLLWGIIVGAVCIGLVIIWRVSQHRRHLKFHNIVDKLYNLRLERRIYDG